MDSTTLIILLCSIGGAVFLIVVFILLYLFVFRKTKIKKQIKELEMKYSFLNGLLIGQDAQFIHRVEIISHTNLVYSEKHNEFQTRFKEIFDSDNSYAEQKIKKLNALVSNNQYRNIKTSLAEAKKALEIFETNVNQLDADLYSLIKLEEESRVKVLKIKENYRQVKQVYFANSNDLELVGQSINKIFTKLDSMFAQYEELVESANYDDAYALIPTIVKAISALDNALKALPDLCSLLMQVIPQKISDLENFVHEVTRLDIPTYHLALNDRFVRWSNELRELKKTVSSLSISGVKDSCNRIISEIEETDKLLEQEVADKKVFEEENLSLSKDVSALDKKFYKMCAILPEIQRIYVFEESQKHNIEILKFNINQLWATKRQLEGFIHSETKQPYSLLKKKLTDLRNNYETSNTALNDFKAYLESLNLTCTSAKNIIGVYFYRLKQVELSLRQMALPQNAEKYKEDIEKSYLLLNEIDSFLKEKPIDVLKVNEKVEELKAICNPMFSNISDEERECTLAENAIVYANRDRQHQNDINQQLTVIENNFFNGEFERVHEDATTIIQNHHFEEQNKNGK